MKKYKIYLIIAVIILTIPIIYKMMIQKKETTYKVGNFQVKENFHITNKKHYYDFSITNKKEQYSFSLEMKMNKRTKIIKEIKLYQEKDVTCIIPIYKKNIEKEIYCRKGNKQVSKEYLKEDASFNKILKKIKKYKIPEITNSDTKKEFKNVTIYKNNIPENHTLLIWDYKGIILINKEKETYQKFLKNDLYDNIMATTTNRYFVLFENTSVNGIQTIHYYDLKKEKYETMKPEIMINKDSYINGVVDNEIYVTDRKAEKQYSINIKKETIKEVGNETAGFIKWMNNKKETVDKKSFLKEDQLFQNERMKNKKVTKSSDLIKEGNVYYYKEGNSLYEQIEKNNKVLLLEEEKIEEWNVFEKEVLIRKDGSLYLYNDTYGLKKLIDYNELNYNYNHIYYLWK